MFSTLEIKMLFFVKPISIFSMLSETWSSGILDLVNKLLLPSSYFHWIKKCNFFFHSDSLPFKTVLLFKKVLLLLLDTRSSLKMEVQREATPWILMTCVSQPESRDYQKGMPGRHTRESIATRVDCSSSSIWKCSTKIPSTLPLFQRECQYLTCQGTATVPTT